MDTLIVPSEMVNIYNLYVVCCKQTCLHDSKCILEIELFFVFFSALIYFFLHFCILFKIKINKIKNYHPKGQLQLSMHIVPTVDVTVFFLQKIGQNRDRPTCLILLVLCLGLMLRKNVLNYY